jgi:hypothetical protein
MKKLLLMVLMSPLTMTWAQIQSTVRGKPILAS